jgi:integrase
VPVATQRTPSYRLHKPSGLAVTTIDGRDFYLGAHDTPGSRAEYDRLVAEWLAAGRRLPARLSPSAGDLTINEMLVAYLAWADGYYVKGGQPTSEPTAIRGAIKPLRQLYAHTLARDFGPLALKAVRQAMIQADLCRNEVNKRARHVIRAFKWAVAEEMVPPSVHHGLKAVAGLRRGRTGVRESLPVRPAPEAFVDAVQPFVSRQVWARIELQRLTGMRPGEVCIMRTSDLDTSGRVWTYVPESHKTEHHGRARRIHIGPRAQLILRPWLRTELTAYLFQPAEAMQEHRAELRANRRTPMTPSQAGRRRKRKPRKSAGERYTPDSYWRAIHYACDRAFPHPELARLQSAGRTAAHRAALRVWTVEHRAELLAWRREHRWHPHQLRHNAATRLRKEFGLDVARAVLGHASPVVTEVYAELDGAKAAEAMERVG